MKTRSLTEASGLRLTITTCLLFAAVSSGFAPLLKHQQTGRRPAPDGPHDWPIVDWQRATFASALSMSKQFDMSRPQFDLYAFRQVRGDALTKYNSLNQSEPLRINLLVLMSLGFAVSPWLVEELNSVALTVPQTAISVAGAVGCAYLLVRECQARNRQIARLEKELEALSLSMKLPANLIADTAFLKPLPVMSILKTMGCRIIAVSGTSAKLRDTLLTFRVLGKRLQQANTFVVAIPTDLDEGAGLKSSMVEGRWAWLAEPGDLERWKDYFGMLSSDIGQPNYDNNSFHWFGLNPSGRSFGSGATEPSWLQVFGKSLSPVEVLSEDGYDDIVDSSAPGCEIRQCQTMFYDALTNGKMDVMTDIFDTQTLDEEVSMVVREGGRLDSWESCLQDGARPAGMRISGCDVYMVDNTVAYSTCVEFPAALEGSSLLAVQKWKHRDGGWKLQQHQTIPWTPDNPAAGTLICDHRGCVSLVRSAERRTFGGFLG